MNDTYKGESLQKKLARYWTHLNACKWMLGHPGGMRLWEKGAHVFLASREAGDTGVLVHHGVRAKNIVGVDRCAEAIALCSERWGGLLQGKEQPIFLECADISEEVARIERSGSQPVASVFLDFCAPLNRETIGCISRTWREMRVGAFLSVAFLKGRESKQRPAYAGFSRFGRHQRRAMRTVTRDSAFALADKMIRGEAEWDVSGALSDLAKRVGTTDLGIARLAMLTHILDMADPLNDAELAYSLFYQSKTKQNNGVPMMIVGAGKTPSGARGPWPKDNLLCRLTDAAALDWRNEMLSKLSAGDAAMVLNVTPSTASALKAHVTRGTYANTGVAETVRT